MKSRLKNKQGMTLVEAMIYSTVVSIVILAFIQYAMAINAEDMKIREKVNESFI